MIRLVTTSGSTVASYVYDAWGNVISSSGTMAEINPIRYRGYYYDTETGLYYLGSRYYDPAVKRFINADGYASTGQDFIGYNMFAYCNNNPVSSTDADGDFTIGALAVAGALGGLSGLIGAAASGDSLAVGFVVGALTSSASVVFSAGFIGNLAISLIGEVYEALANNPTTSIKWDETMRASILPTLVDSALGNISGVLLKGLGDAADDFIVQTVIDCFESLVGTTVDVANTAYEQTATTNNKSKNNGSHKSSCHRGTNKIIRTNGASYRSTLNGYVPTLY